jgi:IS30 family transposase
MARYHRVGLVEREGLNRLSAAGSSFRAIGQPLSRAPSLLSRERARHHTLEVLGLAAELF